MAKSRFKFVLIIINTTSIINGINSTAIAAIEYMLWMELSVVVLP